MTPRVWAWLVLILGVAFAVSPVFSDGFNGYTKDQFPIVLDHWPAQPAGWAFSIWGVIYAWLIAGSAYGALREATDPGWQAMRPALVLSLAFGVPWITVANANPVAATVMIVIMAVGAIIAFLEAGEVDPLWLAGPLGLYAGWLTAATGVASAVVLSGYGLLSGQAAALILLVIVLLVALTVQALRPDGWSYPLAVGWALFGIVIANIGAGDFSVAGLAVVGILALLWRFMSHRRKAV